MPSAFVSPAWLAEHLMDDAVRIMDASWYMSADSRDTRGEYDADHIPGAVFFDIDAASDHTTDLPHMLPTPETFGETVSALGIGNQHHVVVYDSKGLFSAPRVWWMFRVFGHEHVSILEGGLPAWKENGGEVASLPTRHAPAHFTATFHPELVRSKSEVETAIGNIQILDARAANRFLGETPEPRPGLRSGHIPGSKNLPFGQLLDEKGRLRPQDETKSSFAAADIDPARPTITTCGSGISACVLAVALYELGNKDVAVYDGSWAEWGKSDAA